MEFKFSDVQNLTKKMVSEFCAKEVDPIAKKLDSECTFPRGIIEKLRQLKLLGLLIPEKYNGANLDMQTYALIIEELSKSSASLGITLGTHCILATYPILLLGTEEQKNSFLPSLADGKLGAFALCEPTAGSDIEGIQTTAELHKDSYILNGSKTFITNGSVAEYILVVARLKEKNSIEIFVVEKNTPGFHIKNRVRTMGLKSADIVDLYFENCRIPLQNKLGEKNTASISAIQKTFSLNRISVAALSLGIAEASYEKAVEYANTRMQFGVKIGTFQGVQDMLVNMAVGIDAGKLLLYKAAFLKDNGEDFEYAAAIAKLYASQIAVQTAIDAVQIHGGIGFMREYPVERYYRDAKAMEIYGGTSEILRNEISKRILNL